MKKNKFRIIYIILISLVISGILQYLYNIFFTGNLTVDGCAWSNGTTSLYCKMINYFEPIVYLLVAILIMFIATIISYKLIYTKKLTLTEKDRKKIYITLEILLLYKWIINLPSMIYFIVKTQKMGIIAVILPIISSIGLFIIVSWLLNKIVYQKRIFRNKNIMILSLILGIVLLIIPLLIMYSNIIKNYNKEYNKYLKNYSQEQINKI